MGNGALFLSLYVFIHLIVFRTTHGTRQGEWIYEVDSPPSLWSAVGEGMGVGGSSLEPSEISCISFSPGCLAGAKEEMWRMMCDGSRKNESDDDKSGLPQHSFASRSVGQNMELLLAKRLRMQRGYHRTR